MNPLTKRNHFGHIGGADPNFFFSLRKTVPAFNGMNEKKKVEELEAAKSRLQQELDIHTLKLKALQAQLTARKLSSDAELRVQVLAEVEEARQRDIQRLKDQIKSLTERD